MEFEIIKAPNTVVVDLTAQEQQASTNAAALANARRMAASISATATAASAAAADADAAASSTSSTAAAATSFAVAEVAPVSTSASAANAALVAAADAAPVAAGRMCVDRCRVTDPNCGDANCHGTRVSSQATAAATYREVEAEMAAAEAKAAAVASAAPSSNLVQVQKEVFLWNKKTKVNESIGYSTVACFIVTGTKVKEISVSRLRPGGKISVEDTVSNLFLTIMNKLSAENADSLFDEILALHVDTPADCKTIAKLAFNAALHHKKFQDLFARIFIEIGRQTQTPPYPWKACEPSSGKGANFFQLILENCQSTFDSRKNADADEKKILSLCTFIGHLYNESKVDAFIIPYLNALLKDFNSELDIKSFHAMLTICGKQLHTSFYGKILVPKYRGYMYQYQLDEKYRMKQVGLACKNMVELIDDGWVPRGAAATLEFQQRTVNRQDARDAIIAEEERVRQRLLEGGTPLTDADLRASNRALEEFRRNRASGSPGSTGSSGFLTRNSPTLAVGGGGSPLAGGGGGGGRSSTFTSSPLARSRSPTFTSSPLASSLSPTFGAGDIPSLQLGHDDGGLLELFPEHECTEGCSRCRLSPSQPLFMRSSGIGGGGSAAAAAIPAWCSSLSGGASPTSRTSGGSYRGGALGGGGGDWEEQRAYEAAIEASLQPPAPLPPKAAAECEGCDYEGCPYCFAPDNGETYDPNPLGF